jgi:Domain of unknown function (DUF4276)
MKRLYLTVEGQTEQEFAVKVLTPHLAVFNVFTNTPRLTGPHRRRRGRIPQGGMFNTFSHALADMRTWMKEDASPDARFSMMVDLFSLPADFPGFNEGMAKQTGRQKALALQHSLSEHLGDSRFIPYLQCHEFEALVLVDPMQIGLVYDVGVASLTTLSQDCNQFDYPEEIDLGPHSHPKFRIKSVVPEYDENIAGPLLAECIGLATLRNRCPHFGEWLTRLEKLDSVGS